jgi:hypothetical protein
MGIDNLEKLAAAPTKVPATTTQYNAVVDSLQGHQVMRESDGTVIDGTYDIGRPSSGRPRKLYLGDGGISIDGQDIDLSKLALKRTAIYSGKEKTSGYPDFLEAGLTTRKATLEAADTDFVFTINGEGFTLEVDLLTDNLLLAPAANNTATVDTLPTPVHLGGGYYRETIGEYGYWFPISAFGAEVSALDETIQGFKSDTEIFLGKIDEGNSRIIPLFRGMGGTNRTPIATAATLTLLKTSYLFLNKDLDTITASTTFPIYSATEPASGATDDYYYNTQTQGWNKWTGAEWEAVDDIYIGMAFVDTANCIAVECEDFEKLWDATLDFGNMETLSDTEIAFNGQIVCSVAGELIETKSESIAIDITDAANREGGAALQAEKWYYCYIDKFGVMKISVVVPRNKGVKKGCYHPREYWRCIGVVYVDAGNLITSSYSPKNKKQFMSEFTDLFPLTDVTTNESVVFAFVPHISVLVGVNVTVSGVLAGEQILYGEPAMVSRPGAVQGTRLYYSSDNNLHPTNFAVIPFLKNTLLYCHLRQTKDDWFAFLNFFELDL